MKKTLFIVLCFCIVGLFFIQKTYSQENITVEALKSIIEEYINILVEKEIKGQDDNGKQVDPGVIIEGVNWLFLPQGITVFIPVTSDAKDLIKAIGDKVYWVVLGGCEWIISYNSQKNIFVFQDSGK